MLKKRVEEQSNKILFSNLLHLSRIVIFASLPMALHVDYLEYMRDFFRNPPQPGGPIPTPSPYPISLVVITIVVLMLDLILFWKLLSGNNQYELPSIILFGFEVVLLILMPKYQFLIISGISIVGFLEFFLLVERKIKLS